MCKKAAHREGAATGVHDPRRRGSRLHRRASSPRHHHSRPLPAESFGSALSSQEVELSPDDLPVMQRLTKTLQRCPRHSDIALEKKKSYHKSERATDS